MKVDRVTQTLMALIVIALLLNAASAWLNPRPVLAASAQTSGNRERITLLEIRDALQAIASGTCENQMLCSQ